MRILQHIILQKNSVWDCITWGFTTNNLEETEKNYISRPMVFKIGNYKNKVECFGGEISTIFMAIKGLILEFVYNVQKK